MDVEAVIDTWNRLVIEDVLEGGPGSGHHGHSGGVGGPGNPGGSTSGSSSARKGSSKRERAIIFKTGLKANAFGNKMNAPVDKWLNSDDDEAISSRFALESYVNNEFGGAEDINRTLRKGTKGYQEDIKGLDSLMKRSTIPKSVIAFRGIDYETYEKIEKHKGKTFVDKGFVSTTLLSSIVNPKRGPTPYEAVVMIKAPKGTRCYYVNRAKKYGGRNEFELLLDRGTKFKVKEEGWLILEAVK